MKYFILILIAVLLGGMVWLVFFSGSPAEENPMADSNPIQETQNEDTSPISGKIVVLETSLGTIKIELARDDAPNTTQNFLKLTKKGFYDNVIFHRVIEGFMIQGGDPTGTGTGGPGYQFADELNSETPSYKAGYVRGTVAMANAGPNTNGSQFFIMHQDTPLPHNYTIFGKVIAGLDVVDKIATVKTDPADKPLTSVIINRASIQE